MDATMSAWPSAPCPHCGQTVHAVAINVGVRDTFGGPWVPGEFRCPCCDDRIDDCPHRSPLNDFALTAWRVGRRVGRTVYAVVGEAPSDDDVLVGVMDTPTLAEVAVAGHNLTLQRRCSRSGSHVGEDARDDYRNMISTCGTCGARMWTSTQPNVAVRLPEHDTPPR